MRLKGFKETMKTHRRRLGVLLLAAGCWCMASPGYGAIPVVFADLDLGGLVNQVFNKAVQKPQQQPSSSTNLIDSGTPLEITTVGRIYPQQGQSIVIVGHGFGTQNPFNGTSAFLQIHDNTGNWDMGWSGNNDPNPVNVNVKLWNDTLILISGLTGAYGISGRSLNPGDNLTVSVWNPQTGKGPASTNVIVQEGPQQASQSTPSVQSVIPSQTSVADNHVYPVTVTVKNTGSSAGNFDIQLVDTASEGGWPVLTPAPTPTNVNFSVGQTQTFTFYVIPKSVGTHSFSGQARVNGHLLWDGSSLQSANVVAGSINGVNHGTVIASISSILPQQMQAITISGSGFGSQNAFNGTSKYLKIHDDTANWDAGYNGNWINLNVSRWTDTQIVINGFTGAYGLSEWKLNAGDKLTISVWNAQTGNGPVTADVTVASSASQSGGLSGAQPPLTSNISSPAAALLQKMLIGDWVGEGLDDGRIVYVTFDTNGIIELQNVQHSDQGTYSVDWSKRPYSLDVQAGNGPVDESIFEFTNSGIRTEDGRGQSRPTSFTDQAEILKRVNTTQSSMLEGNWAAKDEDSGQTFYWTFDNDGVFTVHANGKSKAGTYLVDASKQPPYLDINQGGDFTELIFEASDSGLRIEGGDSAHARPHTFTSKAIIFTRANNLNSKFPSGSSAVADPFLWGDWVGEEQDSGQVLQFKFSPDGTIVFQRAGGSHAGKYAVDLSQSPANLNVRWNDNSNLKVIFEITNQELHIEGDDEYTRPQHFTDSIQILKKADPVFLSTLQGGWIGGIEASQMFSLGHADTNQILALCTVLTFTSGGVIKSQGHGQSKVGTYAIDGNKDPAYLDISWGNGIVDECICKLRDVSSRTKDPRVKEILMFQDGREQGRPANFDLGVTAYNKASDDEILKILAMQQSINNQSQTTPTNPDEK
jgi:hypothetical protein